MTKVVDNDIISKLKKKQILEEIHSNNPSIPLPILEFIWDSVKSLPEKKLKQIRKGNYKEYKLPKRPVFEDGQILTGCCEIKENAEVPFKPFLIKEEPKKEENEENKIVEVA